MSKLVKILEISDIYLTEDFIRSIEKMSPTNNIWRIRLKYELKIYDKKKHNTSIYFKSREIRKKFFESLQKIHNDLIETPYVLPKYEGTHEFRGID